MEQTLVVLAVVVANVVVVTQVLSNPSRRNRKRNLAKFSIYMILIAIVLWCVDSVNTLMRDVSVKPTTP